MVKLANVSDPRGRGLLRTTGLPLLERKRVGVSSIAFISLGHTIIDTNGYRDGRLPARRP